MLRWQSLLTAVVLGASAAFAGELDCHELLALHDHAVPALEQSALEARNLRRQAPWGGGATLGGARMFFETLDLEFRRDRRYPVTLLGLALRRLPFLREVPFVVVLSGGTVPTWAPVLEEVARQERLALRVLLLPGALSEQGERPPIPLAAPSEAVRAALAGRPAVFLDDTFATGQSAARIRRYLEFAGATLEGVFVVYESGCGETSAIYRSGRASAHYGRAFAFPRSPARWSWKLPERRLALGIENTVLGFDGRLTAAARKLLPVLEKEGVEVSFLRKGHAVDAPKVALTVAPGLRVSAAAGPYPLAMGNWGRTFVGDADGHRPASAEQVVDTVPLRQGRTGRIDHPLWPRRSFEDGDESEVGPTYLLDRLVEVGALVPQFGETPKAVAFAAPSVSTLDAREALVDVRGPRPVGEGTGRTAAELGLGRLSYYARGVTQARIARSRLQQQMTEADVEWGSGVYVSVGRPPDHPGYRIELDLLPEAREQSDFEVTDAGDAMIVKVLNPSAVSVLGPRPF